MSSSGPLDSYRVKDIPRAPKLRWSVYFHLLQKFLPPTPKFRWLTDNRIRQPAARSLKPAIGRRPDVRKACAGPGDVRLRCPGRFDRWLICGTVAASLAGTRLCFQRTALRGLVLRKGFTKSPTNLMKTSAHALFHLCARAVRCPGRPGLLDNRIQKYNCGKLRKTAEFARLVKLQ